MDPLPELPAVERVLRLARHVTDRPYAGANLATPIAAAIPERLRLDPDHPLVRATMAGRGVHEVDDPAPAGPPPLRSYAGVPLRDAGDTPLGALWVGDTEQRPPLDAVAAEALCDLAALLEAELDRTGAMGLAAQVQQQLLPESAPPAPGLEMAAVCRPAQAVGGDFYDWWRTGDKLQLVVADVMGKGVPAAIVAAAVRAMLRAAMTFNEPAPALRRVAGDLQADLDQVARFATCFATQIDLETKQLSFVDAGHGLAAVLRNDGSVTHLRSHDLPIGALPDTTWHARQTSLAPGELLLVVSDGVLDRYPRPTDAVRRAQELYREGATAADYVADLASDDADAPEIEDDVTVVAIRRTA